MSPQQDSITNIDPTLNSPESAAQPLSTYHGVNSVLSHSSREQLPHDKSTASASLLKRSSGNSPGSRRTSWKTKSLLGLSSYLPDSVMQTLRETTGGQSTTKMKARPVFDEVAFIVATPPGRISHESVEPKKEKGVSQKIEIACKVQFHWRACDEKALSGPPQAKASERIRLDFRIPLSDFSGKALTENEMRNFGNRISTSVQDASVLSQFDESAKEQLFSSLARTLTANADRIISEWDKQARFVETEDRHQAVVRKLFGKSTRIIA
ncbi:hypothetical protein QFC21_003480 [Naganishia friedmannii]|uniref:Uncharacterized protein n=1 Tax=Naganishia friedmannii TaxID=89922 RepID=A0ACC2VRK1_9TREE|nr:hypothetical protein QFC21_003480 [Naganishia friedmannii]